MAGANRKKKRTPKTSKGINGAKRNPLTALQKALMGKGAVQSLAARRQREREER